MANTYINKIIFGDQVLLDLSQDDVQASDVLAGKKAHLPSGEPVTGSCPYDADTSDATATADEILQGKTAYKAGSKVTGTMPNNGAVDGTIADKTVPYTVPRGYHDGSGRVTVNAPQLVPNNVREGVTILGVLGTMSGGEGVKATPLSATPYTTAKQYAPADLGDYNYFSQVTVAAIAYTETDNAAGGKTVTIGTVAPS